MRGGDHLHSLSCLTMKQLRIIIGGYLGLLPAGGVTWDYVQYPVGFAALGHDVFYIEDTRLWPIYQANTSGGFDCSTNVAYLARVMDAFGLRDRWAYRDEASGKCFGLSEERVRELCRAADVFVNVSCSTFLRDEYRAIPLRVLVDTDPMFTQIQYVTETMFTEGNPAMRDMVDGHTHHFSFGENIGKSGCRIPTCGINWQPTRQPICLAHWTVSPLPVKVDAAFTTLMNWTAAPPLAYANETWGQKNVEFERFFSFPQMVPTATRLAIAVGQTTGAPFPTDAARANGWRVLDPNVCAADWSAYRAFIQKSRGEFSIAKETYVKARTGWFSCRSACYLATGRPVVAQDTGWSEHLPTGNGLFAFADRQSAREALAVINTDLNKNSRAARILAEEYFDSNLVLNRMLKQIGA